MSFQREWVLIINVLKFFKSLYTSNFMLAIIWKSIRHFWWSWNWLRRHLFCLDLVIQNAPFYFTSKSTYVCLEMYSFSTLFTRLHILFSYPSDCCCCWWCYHLCNEWLRSLLKSMHTWNPSQTVILLIQSNKVPIVLNGILFISFLIHRPILTI